MRKKAKSIKLTCKCGYSFLAIFNKTVPVKIKCLKCGTLVNTSGKVSNLLFSKTCPDCGRENWKENRKCKFCGWSKES
jgi:Zn finger protein HypA/HybF involved in hydrogenase expression